MSIGKLRNITFGISHILTLSDYIAMFSVRTVLCANTTWGKIIIDKLVNSDFDVKLRVSPFCVNATREEWFVFVT